MVNFYTHACNIHILQTISGISQYMKIGMTYVESNAHTTSEQLKYVNSKDTAVKNYNKLIFFQNILQRW